MNERDVKSHGVEVHRRDMAFVKGYVSCTNCECNYSAVDMSPTFCQIYSQPIDPLATDKNTLVAESCDQWVCRGMDRNKVVTPDHSYWYEKESK